MCILYVLLLYMLKIQLILVYDKDGYLLDLKDVVKL